MSKVDVSIIICTRNRAQHLRQTLESLSSVDVPSGVNTELLLVDNGSSDDTQLVFSATNLPGFSCRYITEQRLGLSHARNKGIAESKGEIILFTDDDLRFPSDWIAGMCRLIWQDKADAVVGGIKLAPHLARSWMTQIHHCWLCSTGEVEGESRVGLIGANMAFSREVLHRIPEFDTELGAGALGFGEDTLFSLQLQEAGYRIAPAFDTVVEHHFDESRLNRACWLERALREGRTAAYISYHWANRMRELYHRPLAKKMTRSLLLHTQLVIWRATHRSSYRQQEGAHPSELMILSKIGFQEQLLIEEQRPRNYQKFGLVKLGADYGEGNAGHTFIPSKSN